MSLFDVTLQDWAVLFAAWVLLSIAVGIVVGKSIRLADEHEQPADDSTALIPLPGKGWIQ